MAPVDCHTTNHNPFRKAAPMLSTGALCHFLGMAFSLKTRIASIIMGAPAALEGANYS